MTQKIILSEFEAAQEIKISPTLLRWFTSYSPKNDGRKLKFTVTDGVYYYDKKELLDFNTYLHLPWAKPPKGTRPTIPTGIALEIKTESHYRCPLCNTNIGELAHIKPVSKSFDNHPHNLIFLCPNHHTVYDFGFKYDNISEEEILIHKKAIQSFQSLTWGLQNEIVFSYLSLINKIGRVKELEAIFFKSKFQVEFESILKSILAKIDILKTKKNEDEKIEKLIKSVTTKDKTNTSQTAYSFLSVREKIKSEYEHHTNLTECPLCNSKGFTNEFDTCPVCEGEGYIDKDLDVDISIYEFENCPLCEGRGQTSDFENCPPCNGEGKLTREQIDNIDFTVYEMEDCPLCKGKGYTSDFENCPPCNGLGKLTREQIDDIDFTVYEMEDCPLCKGRGQTSDFENCPPCNGEGKLTREQIDDIDFTAYDMEDCPLCKGRGHTTNFDNCPPCNGEGKLTREQIDDIDFTVYEMENCPLCKGRGHTKKYDDCPPCNGIGKMTRQQIDNTDFQEY